MNQQQTSETKVPEKKIEATKQTEEIAADTVPLEWLSQWPVPTNQIPPNYPEDARTNGIVANVYLKVLIGTTGKPLAAEVQWVKATSMYADTTKPPELLKEWEEPFKQPSIDAVLLWQFTKPIRQSGALACVWINVPLQYNLTR